MSNSVGFLQQGATLTIAASTTVANGTWTGTDVQCDSVRIYNSTNGVAWVCFSKSSAGVVNATNGGANCTPIPPATTDHQISFVRKLPNFDTISVILATGATAGNVYATAGDGGV